MSFPGGRTGCSDNWRSASASSPCDSGSRHESEPITCARNTATASAGSLGLSDSTMGSSFPRPAGRGRRLRKARPQTHERGRWIAAATPDELDAHHARSAPAQARTTRGPAASMAQAANCAITSAARFRGLPLSSRSRLHSRSALLAHLRSERQPCHRSVPALGQGLTRARVRSPETPSLPHSASASAMATAPYRNPRSRPRGADVTTAPQHRHRYRRSLRTSVSAAPVTSQGPTTDRSLEPCPTSPSRLLPAAAPAEPQQGQSAGRTAATPGAACAQSLTSTSKYAIR